jgi:PBSX family phage terminase large subunit
MKLQLRTPDGDKYVPLERQAAFHASPAKYRGYVGGFGSGKTIAGCVEALIQSLEHPGNRGLIGRKSYKELKATTQSEFLRILPKEMIADWNKSDGILKLKNGSEILFWNLENPDTFKSLNLGWFYLDEATEIDEEVFNILRGRIRLKRDSNGKQIRRCGWLTTNPNGHDWVWKFFESLQSKIYYQLNYHLIKSPTRDNKYLPEDYIQDLIETYPPEWLARFMDGSFDAFEGQIYPALSESFHLIPTSRYPDLLEYIKPLAKFRVMDYGFSNPTVVLWYAIDEFGNLFFYNEYRRRLKTIAEHAPEIKSMSEGEEYISFLCDPSMRRRDGSHSKLSLIDEYAEHDLFLSPGNNDIRAGIARVSEYLRTSSDHVNPITNMRPAPKIFFSHKCAATFEEMRGMQWKKIKPGQTGTQAEEPIDKDDHGPDCVRYAVMGRPIAKPRNETEDEYQELLKYIRAFETPDGRDFVMSGRSGGFQVELPNGFVITK